MVLSQFFFSAGELWGWSPCQIPQTFGFQQRWHRKKGILCPMQHIGMFTSHFSYSIFAFVQISKCLGKSFHPNGYGVDAKDLAEKMQLLTTEVSNPAWAISSILVVIFCPISLKYFLFYFQRAEEVADARTSGSVSPSDFFSQTPNENSNFQIPVSCGKSPSLIVWPTLVTWCHCLPCLKI